MWSSFICIIAMLGCGSCIDFLSSGKVRNVDCYVQSPHFKTLAKKSFLWVRYAIIVKKKNQIRRPGSSWVRGVSPFILVGVQVPLMSVTQH